MTEVLPYLSWHVAAILLLLLVVAVVLRRGGEGKWARLGNAMIWLAFAAAAAWAVSSLYEMLQLVTP